MFHTLRKIVIVVFVLLFLGSVAGLGAWAYERRAVFKPITDYVEVLNLPKGPGTLEEMPGVVTKVSDDYTVQIRDEREQMFVFRLAGLAPLPAPVAGDQKTRALHDKVESRLKEWVWSNQVRVAVTYLSPRRSGLGLVYAGETNINAALTVAGLAKVKREFLSGMPRSEQYKLIRAESQARVLKRGLWRKAAEAN